MCRVALCKRHSFNAFGKHPQSISLSSIGWSYSYNEEYNGDDDDDDDDGDGEDDNNYGDDGDGNTDELIILLSHLYYECHASEDCHHALL